MDDLIAVIIIVIGIAAKIYSNFKKSAPEPERESSLPENWEQYFDLPTEPDRKSNSGWAEEEAAQSAGQYEADAEMLESQRRYAEMAEQAAAMNQASCEDEESVIYQTPIEEAETPDNDASDWAELIRNNRTEAVVISEILAPPAALR